jgi:hypothetical protein
VLAPFDVVINLARLEAQDCIYPRASVQSPKTLTRPVRQGE